jgi:hypothetical protein
MKTNTLALLSTIFFILISCEKDGKIKNIECENFAEALIYLQSDSVKNVISKYTFDLNPNKKENDQFGHKENVDLLIERLNGHCDNIEVILGCYACIYTLPPQSEIIILTDSSGIEIKRVVDILTPNDGILRYAGIHKDY